MEYDCKRSWCIILFIANPRRQFCDYYAELLGEEGSIGACMVAIATGDCRDLWRLGSNGQNIIASSGKSLGLKDNVITHGVQIVIEDICI